MPNIQLSAHQRKQGRTHLPALLIHVLETQPAAGSTSSVRALGAEEPVPATLCHPTRYLSAPPKPRCGCAELHLPRAEGAVLVRSSQDCPCSKAHGRSLFQHPAEANSHKVPASHMLIIFPTFFFWRGMGKAAHLK